jgi:protein DJ-1
VRLVPDAGLAELLPTIEQTGFDAVVLPGGAGGAEHLGASSMVGRILNDQWRAGRLLGAMCAAPLALAAHGVATGADVTCYPSLKARLDGTHVWHDERVVVSGHLVTSQGPGTTFEFALALISELVGAEVAQRVRGPLLLQGN